MLSKSQYVRGKQCPLSLWYQHRRYTKDPEIMLGKKSLFRRGKQIEALAHVYFGHQHAICTAPSTNLHQSAQDTKWCLSQGFKIIFEASAYNQDASARIDVLLKTKTGFELVEIKSSNRPKAYQIDDLAFQYYAFTKAGYAIEKCYLMLPNQKYCKQEGDIDVSKFFKLEDLTEKIITLQPHIQESIAQIQVFKDCSHPPEILMGKHCNRPFACEYQNTCNSQNQLSLFNETHNKKCLERKAHCAQDIFDEKKIQHFLSALKPPLLFLDYEVLMSIVPVYPGTHPFEHIPFQFSAHLVTPHAIEHDEFIHKQKTDPRPHFVKKLLECTQQCGSVLVFNKQFEVMQNNKLASQYPAYAKQLQQLNQKMIDLMQPFKQRWVYFTGQGESFSVKKILSAISPLNYKNLDINNGEDAMNIYLQYASGEKNMEQHHWDAMTKYCALDTYSMILILNKLLEICGQQTLPIDLEQHHIFQ